MITVPLHHGERVTTPNINPHVDRKRTEGSMTSGDNRHTLRVRVDAHRGDIVALQLNLCIK